MHDLIQRALLSSYRIVFVRGLMRYPAGRRVFFSLYEIYKQVFEAGPIHSLCAFVPRGGLVIDVGANVGFFTLRFADWVGPDGKVIAIEPEANNFVELARRCSANNLSDIVETHQALVDATPGMRNLVVNPDHPGDHRLGDSGVSTPALTIDGLRAQSGRPVAFIKIDVQGAEMRVLQGAQKTLSEDKPALFVEVDPNALKQFGTSSEALLRALKIKGYLPHQLQKNGMARLLDDDHCAALIARHSYVDLLFLTYRADGA